MRVKFTLKIPNRLGKNVRKFQGGDFFDSHCSFCCCYMHVLYACYVC